MASNRERELMDWLDLQAKKFGEDLMMIDQLRTAYNATPFQPFTIHMADGRKFDVPDWEFISFSYSGRTIIVQHLNDSFTVVDVQQVKDLAVHATASANGQ